MDHEPDVRRVDPVCRLRQDELLGDVVDRVGEVHVRPAEDFFGRFVTSIIRQQVSMASARATEDRLQRTVAVTPPTILKTDPATLRDVGLSEQKAATAIAVAERFASGEWSRDTFVAHSDEDVIDELTTVHGVGAWTAKMQLLFSLGRPDVFPVEDLAIRRGMEVVTGEELTRQEMVDVAERWAPTRSIASLYLWEAVE